MGRKLKNAKGFDLYGRRLKRSKEPHFVTLVAEDDNGNIICWYGKLEGNRFHLDEEVYEIESFAEMPAIEEKAEKGCLFGCAIRKQRPKETLPTWPMLIQYKDTAEENQDEEISIVCIIGVLPEVKVTVLETKLSNINDAGFSVENSFYRVGVM